MSEFQYLGTANLKHIIFSSSADTMPPATCKGTTSEANEISFEGVVDSLGARYPFCQIQVHHHNMENDIQKYY